MQNIQLVSSTFCELCVMLKMGPFYMIALLSCYFYSNAQGQQETSFRVKKNTSIPSFTYRNKQVSPEALISIFSSPADGLSDSMVNLKDSSFTREITIDSAKPWSKMANDNRDWLLCNLGTDYYGGWVRYQLVGKIQDKAIILAQLNGGGTYTDSFVFFLKIEGDMLYKVGEFRADNTRDYNISIRNDEVVYRGQHYKMPK